MPRVFKGCGRPLNFKGSISERDKRFLKYCYTADSLNNKEVLRVEKIESNVEWKNNQGLHILSVIEKIKSRHFFK